MSSVIPADRNPQYNDVMSCASSVTVKASNLEPKLHIPPGGVVNDALSVSDKISYEVVPHLSFPNATLISSDGADSEVTRGKNFVVI